MKKLSFLITAAICLYFTACFDTNEKIMIRQDGSGEYHLAINMDGMLSMMKSFSAGQENADADKVPEKKDTIMYFRDFSDTSTTLTDQEKHMLHDASMTVHLDEEKDEMNFDVRVPFVATKDIEFIRADIGKAMNKIDADKKMFGEKNNESSDDMSAGDNNEDDDMMGMQSSKPQSTNPFEDAYNFSVTGKNISMKLKSATSFKDLVNSDSSMKYMEQMAPMMGSVTYTTTFILPMPAKKYTGNNASATDDKKTITFSVSLSDLIKKPELFEYEVEY